MRARATAAAVTLLALFAGGCTDVGAVDVIAGPARSGPADPVVHDRWESCDATGDAWSDPLGDAQDALTLPLLGDDFQPVAAVICGIRRRNATADGSDMVAVEARADDLAGLLPTLRLPDQAQAGTSEMICTMDLPSVPWLVLLDSEGRWIRPGVPTDSCDKPRTEFREAYEKLTTTVVTSRVVRHLE